MNKIIGILILLVGIAAAQTIIDDTITASYFSGDGSNLTNLDRSNIIGQAGVDTGQNSTVLANAIFSNQTYINKSDATTCSDNEYSRWTGTGFSCFPTVSGGPGTDASNLTEGTLDDARLSSNVILSNSTEMVAMQANDTTDRDYLNNTFPGSAFITTLGTIGTGIWQGSVIADGYISSASTWNAKTTLDTVNTSAQISISQVTGQAGIDTGQNTSITQLQVNDTTSRQYANDTFMRYTNATPCSLGVEYSVWNGSGFECGTDVTTAGSNLSYDFVMRTNGTHYFAKSSRTGADDSVSTNFTVVMEYVRDQVISQGGGGVFIKSGNYYVDSTFTWNNLATTTIMGEGAGTTRIYLRQNNITFIKSNSITNTRIGHLFIKNIAGTAKPGSAVINTDYGFLNRFTNLHIEDMYDGFILWNATLQYTYDMSLYGILNDGFYFARRGEANFMRDVLFDWNATTEVYANTSVHIRGTGGHSFTNVWNLHAKNGLMLDQEKASSSGLEYRLGYIWADSIVFDLNSQHAVNITPSNNSDTYSIVFSNSWFGSNTKSGIFIDGTTGTVDGVTCIACRFFNNGEYGVELKQGGSDTVLNINILDSKIATNTLGGIKIGAGIDDFVIRGNTIAATDGKGDNGGKALQISGASTNYEVTNNNFGIREFSDTATGETGAGPVKIVFGNRGTYSRPLSNFIPGNITLRSTDTNHNPYFATRFGGYISDAGGYNGANYAFNGWYDRITSSWVIPDNTLQTALFQVVPGAAGIYITTDAGNNTLVRRALFDAENATFDKNVSIAGSVIAGRWKGDKIDDQYIASSAMWNSTNRINSSFIVPIGNGSSITTGSQLYNLTIPFSGVIKEVGMLATETGNLNVSVRKVTYAAFPGTPTTIGTIEMLSSVKTKDGTLSGWTTTIAAGDILSFNVNSVSGIKYADLNVILQRD